MRKDVPSIEHLTDVVWLQTGFIGDIILNTAACAWLRKNFPNVRQHFITTPVGDQALKDEKMFYRIWVFDKRRQNFFRAAFDLRKKLRVAVQDPRTTVMLQAHRSYRSSLLARAMGFYTVTYAESGLAWLASRTVTRVACFHESVRIALLLQGIGVKRESILDLKPQLTAGKDLNLWPKNSREKVVGIAPGSVWATKRWPVEKYAQLVNALLTSEPGNRVILIGSKDEAQEAKAILAAADGEVKNRIVDLIGKTSLTDLRSIYPHLDLLVSNDSSPIHYASAFNVPTVAIFGATTPELGFAPMAAKQSVVERQLSCRPCGEHGPKKCPLVHFKCMQEIEVAEVLQTCSRILAPR